MYIAGIFVQVDAQAFDLVVPDISSMCHVEVTITDAESGRLLLSVHGDNERQDKQIIEKIRSLPFVIAAEIIYFQYMDEQDLDSNGAKRVADDATYSCEQLDFLLHTLH